jgi:HEAT repeat protein
VLSGEPSAANGSIAPAEPSSAPAETLADSPPPSTDDREAGNLIDVYFELEGPQERDALFDQLVQIPSPLVNDFLRVMMHQDEDEYVRAAAAAELARRGVADGIQALMHDLDDPEEPFFFEQAVQVLCEVLGSDFYDTLVALWRDTNRDAGERCEAMLGLESIDPQRALGDFVIFLDGIDDVTAMEDDQVEVAMMAFVRHGYDRARPSLERLEQTVRAAPNLDVGERAELLAFVQEGIALLESERQPAGD